MVVMALPERSLKAGVGYFHYHLIILAPSDNLNESTSSSLLSPRTVVTHAITQGIPSLPQASPEASKAVNNVTPQFSSGTSLDVFASEYVLHSTRIGHQMGRVFRETFMNVLYIRTFKV